MTPAERRERARLAAHARWSRTGDRVDQLAPARAGLQARFEREVDPNNELPEDERAKRAENARAAHMARMRLARSKNAQRTA